MPEFQFHSGSIKTSTPVCIEGTIYWSSVSIPLWFD